MRTGKCAFGVFALLASVTAADLIQKDAFDTDFNSEAHKKIAPIKDYSLIRGDPDQGKEVRKKQE